VVNRLDLHVIPGDHRVWPLVFSDEAGHALDLSDATVVFTLKQDITRPDNAAGVVQLRITNHVDAQGGETEIVLTSTASSALEANALYHAELKLISATGKPWTVVQGVLRTGKSIGQTTS